MRASRLSGCSTEGLGLELLVATMINLAETVEGVSDTLRDIHEGGA
jgi:hypothetical protein